MIACDVSPVAMFSPWIGFWDEQACLDFAYFMLLLFWPFFAPSMIIMMIKTSIIYLVPKSLLLTYPISPPWPPFLCLQGLSLNFQIKFDIKPLTLRLFLIWSNIFLWGDSSYNYSFLFNLLSTLWTWDCFGVIALFEDICFEFLNLIWH